MCLRLAALLVRQLAQMPLVTVNLQTANFSWQPLPRRAQEGRIENDVVPVVIRNQLWSLKGGSNHTTFVLTFEL